MQDINVNNISKGVSTNRIFNEKRMCYQ